MGRRGHRNTGITGLGGLQMRDVMHAIATALVIAVAALCTIVQVADVQHGVDRLRHDDSAVQQVGFEPTRSWAGNGSGSSADR
jgi:hypothetical protein